MVSKILLSAVATLGLSLLANAASAQTFDFRLCSPTVSTWKGVYTQLGIAYWSRPASQWYVGPEGIGSVCGYSQGQMVALVNQTAGRKITY